MKITKATEKLSPYVPGEQPSARQKVIKLNTNENPYPPSPRCAKALAKLDTSILRLYPDPVFTKLREQLAKLHKTTPEKIFIGNGSDEILALVAKAFVENSENIASLDPSYSLYKTIAAIRSVKWVGDKINAKTSLFFWTNPNAPTGEFAESAVIEKFAAKFPGVIIIDEAYADFARDNCMNLATAKNNSNIIVMRTLSKSYSLAGLRLGYCVGPENLIEALYKIKDSYNVDTIAQLLALEAIKDQKWMKKNAAAIIATRKKTTDELIRRGWDVKPSETNFIFARPPENSFSAEKIYQLLKRHNIFVRFFSGKKTEDRLRITIGTPEEMEKLLSKIDKIMIKR
jgi:histidinol-phosphate aminotransferase